MKTFEAYRMMQYEKNQKSLGSRKSNVDHLISPIFGDHDLGRNIGIISIQYLTLELLQSLSYRRCQSLLIILPTKQEIVKKLYSNETFYKNFNEIEHYLLTNSFDFSIFFAFNDNDIIDTLLKNANNLFEKYGNKNIKFSDIIDTNTKKQKLQLMSPFSLHDLYQIKGGEESIPITSVKYTNLFSKINSNYSNNKYIVITANHDSYGIVPNLAFGVNDNGSGITSIMCLMNLFYKLYEKTNNYKYDLLFLLTAQGYTNYKGATKWIEDNKGGKTLLNNIEMVICIDSIAIGQKLFIYTTETFINNKQYKTV